MQIKNVDARLQRLTETLAHLLDGDFATSDIQGDLQGDIEDDLLGRIEETVQFLVLDIKTVTIANREKEASLLMQQQELLAKTDLLEIQQQNLHEKTQTIERQAAAIRALSTPVIEVWAGVLVLPIIGTIDTQRGVEIMSKLLSSIVERGSEWVIIDVTGVDDVDTRTAEHLIEMTRAAGLLGTSCLLCGLQPAVAQTLVALGVELGGITMKRNLNQALVHCARHRQLTASGSSNI
jgi:rsbT co-antagonist protein RsbR